MGRSPNWGTVLDPQISMTPLQNPKTNLNLENYPERVMRMRRCCNRVLGLVGHSLRNLFAQSFSSKCEHEYQRNGYGLVKKASIATPAALEIKNCGLKT